MRRVLSNLRRTAHTCARFCHRDDARCRCDDTLLSLVPQQSLVRIDSRWDACCQTYGEQRTRAHVAVIATIKPGKSQAKNPRTASPLTSLITAALSLATIKPGKSQAKNPRTASPLTSLITAIRAQRLRLHRSSPQRIASRRSSQERVKPGICAQRLRLHRSSPQRLARRGASPF